MDSVLDSIWKHRRQAEQLYSSKIPYCDGFGSSHKHHPWLSAYRAHPAFHGSPELPFPFSPLSLSLSRSSEKKLVTSFVFLRSEVIRESLNITGRIQRTTWSGLHSRVQTSGNIYPRLCIHTSIHPSSPVLVTQRVAEMRAEGRAVRGRRARSSVDDLTLTKLRPASPGTWRDAWLKGCSAQWDMHTCAWKGHGEPSWARTHCDGSCITTACQSQIMKMVWTVWIMY